MDFSSETLPHSTPHRKMYCQDVFNSFVWLRYRNLSIADTPSYPLPYPLV